MDWNIFFSFEPKVGYLPIDFFTVCSPSNYINTHLPACPLLIYLFPSTNNFINPIDQPNDTYNHLGIYLSDSQQKKILLPRSWIINCGYQNNQCETDHLAHIGSSTATPGIPS